MNLHTLQNVKGARHRRKRLGRGHGSGLGKTSGKGHKGQMARSGHKHKEGFEGGQMPFFRTVPKRGFKNPNKKTFAPVNLSFLEERFEDGAEVSREAIYAAGLANGGHFSGIKILGDGELSKKLTVVADKFSESARSKIEAAGGTCTVAE
ncbi:MAG: 50S ribosomal protein L15 [Kiritimatiellia bacterium]